MSGVARLGDQARSSFVRRVRRVLRSALPLAGLAAALPLVTSCAGAAVRRPPGEGRAIAAGVLQIRWRTPIHTRELFEAAGEECSSGALVGGRLVIGSRGAKIHGVDTATGRIAWTTPATGGIDAPAIHDQRRGHVYVGADDGTLSAVDPTNGSVRWSFKANGALERAPEIGPEGIYLSTAADRTYALDPRTGKTLWQYEREPPEGFVIHGYAAPRLANAKDVVYAGYSDGYLVALRAGTGELVWARSLAGSSDQFVDVDSTPALWNGLVMAGSYTGGLSALDATDGTTRWHVDVEGAGSPVVSTTGGDARLYLTAPRAGLHAMDPRDGSVLWRQGLAEAGDLTPPIVTGSLLVFSGSRAGVFVVDRVTGSLLQVFDPGGGVCAAPTVDAQGQTVYVLANSGTLYALSLSQP